MDLDLLGCFGRKKLCLTTVEIQYFIKHFFLFVSFVFSFVYSKHVAVKVSCAFRVSKIFISKILLYQELLKFLIKQNFGDKNSDLQVSRSSIVHVIH